MITERTDPSMLFRKLLDLFGYVVVLAGGVYAVAVVVALAFGSEAILVVHVTFVLGFLMFGYATYLLWPSRPWETRVTDDGRLEVVNDEPGEAIETREETEFQSAVRRLPVLSRYPLAPSERFHPGIKLFATSVAVLGLSFATEVAFV